MGETSEKLLEKIPVETFWALTAQTLTRLVVIRIHTTRPFLGVGEGIIAPVMAVKKYEEINTKIFAEGGKKLFSMAKEAFNIPVENTTEAAKLEIVAVTLLQGPEWEGKIVEASPERAVIRVTKCAWMERYKEHGVDLKFVGCPQGHQAWAGEGINAINPKISYKITKSMPWGDPYCEFVYEFKEE